MPVPAFPELRIADLLRRPEGGYVFEKFYGKSVTGFYHGRGALWRGIKLLNLGRGDKVLLPSYHCGVEVEAVLEAGVGVEFYRIRDEMTIDLEALEEQVRAGCGAVLVIHYYGFPQPIEDLSKLCRRHNAFLIEDCAHALFGTYGNQPLGTYGDMAIFSPPKSLPLPGGGILLMNNPDFAPAVSVERPSAAVVWKRTLGLLARAFEEYGDSAILRAGLAGVRSLSRNVLPIEAGTRYDTGMGFAVAMGRIGMPAVSKRIMNGTPIEWIVRKRRQNFQYLVERIHDADQWAVCFRSLPEGICPLFFPMRIGMSSRHEVQMVLKRLGVETFVFGEQLHRDLRKGEFPEAERLAREVLCLPVHQHLDERKMEWIASAMNSIGGRASRGQAVSSVRPHREGCSNSESARAVGGDVCVLPRREGT